MEFEQCEIRANRYSIFPLNCEFEFVAEAVGPDGTYVTARTQRFPPYEPTSISFLWMPRHGFYEPDDKRFQRECLNDLVNHLIRVKWEPLAESGVNWYSRKFRRHVSLYVPDPDPSTPYILGDDAEWRQRALKAVGQYERRRDAVSCRKLADSFMRFGLALERVRQFEEACTFYRYAAQYFEEVRAVEDATKASRWAERVLEYRIVWKPEEEDTHMSNLDSLRQEVRVLWRQVNRFLEENERREPIKRQLVAKSLELATEIINDLYRSSPSIEQFNKLASETSGVLNDVIQFSNDDDAAEREYQGARLSELAAGVYPDRDGRRFVAGRQYERAVEYSKRGSGEKLAFYEGELAAFRRR